MASGSENTTIAQATTRYVAPRQFALHSRLHSESIAPTREAPARQPPLDEYFNSLFTAMGPQHWWPGRTQFEIIVGAILTQNTSWTNVERAIANLRKAGLLTPRAMRKAR